MNRSNLVDALAERVLAEGFEPLSRYDTEMAVRVILEIMSDALVRGRRVEVRNFGRFAVKRRPPRTGRNPRTGASVVVPEKRMVHFKPGKALREAVDHTPPSPQD
jgi:integration host factor subunit beta